MGSTENGLEETADLLEGSERVETGVINANGVAEYTKYIGRSVGKIYVTRTEYSYYPENDNQLKDLGINTAPIGLINIGSDYRLASRCVAFEDVYCEFNLQWVSSDGELTSSGYMIHSDTMSNDLIDVKVDSFV